MARRPEEGAERRVVRHLAWGPLLVDISDDLRCAVAEVCYFMYHTSHTVMV